MTIDEFVAYTSRFRLGVMTLVSLLFVFSSLWVEGVFGPLQTTPSSLHHKNQLGIWVGIVFFGLASLECIRRMLRIREELRVGTAGIRWAPWSDQTIPWSEITEVTTSQVFVQRFVNLHLRNPARFPGRGGLAWLAPLNRAVTGGEISVSLSFTNRSVRDAMSAIQRFRGS